MLQGSRLNGADPASLGLIVELDAIAAVVIGGTSLSGGKGQVWSTVIGVLILGLISNILVISDINSNCKDA